MNRQIRRAFLVASALACTAGAANAEVMIGLSADKQVVYDSQYKSTAIYNDGNWYMRAGLGATTIRRSVVFVLQLPTAVDPKLNFTSADFRCEILSTTGSTSSTPGANPVPTFNLDLYAVRVAATSTVLAGDFYAGSTADPNATLIQDNFITPTSPIRVSGNPNYSTTSDTADATLAAYLNQAYAQGANAGKYVFMRLSPDFDTVTTDMATMNYTLVSAEAGTNPEKPTITYTAVVPEPAAIAFLAGLPMLLRRRAR